MSRNRYDKERERTRLAFLNAALGLILEKGYHQVTVSDITRRTDYGRSTFYEHFANKEEVAWAILEQHVLSLNEEIALVTNELDSPEQEWVAWLMICKDIVIQREVFLKMDHDVSRRLRQRQRDLLIEGFQHQYEIGTSPLLAKVPPDIRARFVVGASLEILDYWLTYPELGTAEDVAAIIFRLLYRIAPPKIRD